MKVGVIGTGHVGLPTAAPYVEPGLKELVEEGRSSGRLRFVPEIADLVAGAEVVFLCVGTPPRATGEANLVAVEKAARAVAEAAEGPRCARRPIGSSCRSGYSFPVVARADWAGS